MTPVSSLEYLKPPCVAQSVTMENAAQVACFSNQNVEVMLDTATIRAVTFIREDFITYKDKSHIIVIKGVVKGLYIKGCGVVQCQLQTNDSAKIVLNLKAYHLSAI
eukprot:11294900-Ditylum_brightwellii.AAC.1